MTSHGITPMKRIAVTILLLLLAWVSLPHAATGTLFPSPWFYALDANGNPVNGAKACFYTAGTSTPATTYSDVLLTSQNTNPVVANSAGVIGPIYLTPGQSYKLILQDATGTALTCDGAVIRTQDNIAAVPTSAANLDLLGTAGEALTAGQSVYLSDGSGGKNAGQWYKADATNTYSSTNAELGIVPASISSGSSGTIRLGGSATGLSSLTPGTDYYVSGTAGGVTSTAPVNKRLLGRADTTTTLVLVGNPPIATVPVNQGGTGIIIGTAHGVVVGEGTSPMSVTVAGTTGQILGWATTGGDPAPAASSTFGASVVLLKANSGTDTAVGATNVDTFAITGLTAHDRILVEVGATSVTQQTAGLKLVSSTDANGTIAALDAAAAIVAGETVSVFATVTQSQASTTTYWGLATGRGTTTGERGSLTAFAATTSYQGAWTIALRHTGVTAGGTFQWRWAIYKVLGQ